MESNGLNQKHFSSCARFYDWKNSTFYEIFFWIKLEMIYVLKIRIRETSNESLLNAELQSLKNLQLKKKIWKVTKMGGMREIYFFPASFFQSIGGRSTLLKIGWIQSYKKFGCKTASKKKLEWIKRFLMLF